MLLELTGALALGLTIGFFIGRRYTDNQTIVRLRNRGYIIKYRSGGYYSSYSTGWYFVYHGFDNKLRSVTAEGELLPTFADAVANADAHYYAKTFPEEHK